jgi:hypothetical protein
LKISFLVLVPEVLKYGCKQAQLWLCMADTKQDVIIEFRGAQKR